MKRATIIFAVGLLALIVIGLLAIRSDPFPRELSQTEFDAIVQSNRLVEVRLYYPPKPGQADGIPVMLHEVRGTFYQANGVGQKSDVRGKPLETPFIARVHLTPALEAKLLTNANWSVVETIPIVHKASERVYPSKQ